jgi:hypothetical protein
MAVGQGRGDHCGGGGVGPGGEDVDTGGGHAGEDFGGLFGRFVLRVDDFGEAGAKSAVVIDARVAEVFVGKIGESLCGGGWGEGAGLDLGEEFEESGFVHDLCGDG